MNTKLEIFERKIENLKQKVYFDFDEILNSYFVKFTFLLG